MRVLVMILVVGVLFVSGLVMAWYFVVRIPSVATISKRDFDHAYDELVAKGELVDRGADRDAAWRDFVAWQARNEHERMSWDEGTGE
jgi:hypothetical protein